MRLFRISTVAAMLAVTLSSQAGCSNDNAEVLAKLQNINERLKALETAKSEAPKPDEIVQAKPAIPCDVEHAKEIDPTLFATYTDQHAEAHQKVDKKRQAVLKMIEDAKSLPNLPKGITALSAGEFEFYDDFPKLNARDGVTCSIQMYLKSHKTTVPFEAGQVGLGFLVKAGMEQILTEDTTYGPFEVMENMLERFSLETKQKARNFLKALASDPRFVTSVTDWAIGFVPDTIGLIGAPIVKPWLYDLYDALHWNFLKTDLTFWPVYNAMKTEGLAGNGEAAYAAYQRYKIETGYDPTGYNGYLFRLWYSAGGMNGGGRLIDAYKNASIKFAKKLGFTLARR